MDRKETEFRAAETATSEATRPDSTPVDDPRDLADLTTLDDLLGPKTAELLSQGDGLFARGLHYQAIHVWTRILFLDRGNPEARLRIERAKGALAEHQRRLDLEASEAARLIEAGKLDEARERLSFVLAFDPRHSEAAQLAAKLEALERRSDSASRSPDAPEPKSPDHAGPPKGIVVRVPKSPTVRQESSDPHGKNRWKMTAFLAVAVVLFAGSAFYLHENWDAIVSDGAFGRPATVSSPVLPGRETPPVPTLSEIRYYNGSRLFAQGRYREALAELGRVERGSPASASARSLILRIEERLLRSASDGEEPALERDADVASRPAEGGPGSSPPDRTERAR